MALVLAHFMNIFQSSPALTPTAETTTKAMRSFILSVLKKSRIRQPKNVSFEFYLLK